MSIRVEHLRTRHTGRDATYRDHRPSRVAPARVTAGRGLTHFTRGLVREPEGESVGAEGVQRDRKEERVQGYRDASGCRAYGG